MSGIWTQERIEMLQRLWQQGRSASQIAEELGGISRNAVIGKAHRLELTARPSPIKRDGEKAAPCARCTGLLCGRSATRARPTSTSAARTRPPAGPTA